jgi:hypothetical protein
MVVEKKKGRANMVAQLALSPGLIATYGPMGTGKSSDLIATCLGDGVFFGAKNGLQVGTTSFGVPAGLVESRTVEVRSMEDVPKGIRWAAEQGYGSIGIDDGSLLMKMSFMKIQENHAIVRNGVQKGYDMAMWGILDRLIFEIASTAATCGIRVYMNFHQREPSQDRATGTFHIGGPDLSWKQLTPRIGYHFDLVQQTVKDPNCARWDGQVRCDERNPRYTQKNRLLETLTEAPLNTAEMLRASGREVKRPTGLEWMEDVAETLCVSILSGIVEKEARKPVKDQLVSRNLPPKLIRWALRDGTHRARIRRATLADAILSSL